LNLASFQETIAMTTTAAPRTTESICAK